MNDVDDIINKLARLDAEYPSWFLTTPGLNQVAVDTIADTFPEVDISTFIGDVGDGYFTISVLVKNYPMEAAVENFGVIMNIELHDIEDYFNNR